MKVFVIFRLNPDNYQGVVIGDSYMTRDEALDAFRASDPLLLDGCYAIEEECFIDGRSHDLINTD